MNKFLTATFTASVAVCTIATTPAHAADAASAKGILDSGWNYVQYLFADGAASAAMSDANKAAAAKSNVLGLGAARELQIQAEAQIQQRDFLAADKTLRRALSLAPELVSTQALLAVAINGQGRETEARSMLDALEKNATRASASASTKAETMTPVAGAHYAIGDPKRALQIYNQLIAENVDSAAVHAGRGETLQRLDDDLAALASFQLASEVEPRFPNLELKRAQSLEKLGRNSEAENAYRVALQLDPSSAASRTGLARLEGRRPAAVTEPAVASTGASMAPVAAVAAPMVMEATAAASSKESTKDSSKEDAAKAWVKKAVADRLAALNVVAEKMATPTASVPSASAAPAPQANAEKAPSSEVQAAVLAVLSKWQAAWAGKDIEAYLGYYAKGFKPVKMNRVAWEADRRVKLNKPGQIQLNIVEPTFETEGGVLKVNFTQEYTSSNFRDKSRKRLDWVQEGGEWRIQREAAL